MGADDGKERRILAAATRVFARQGFHAARVADIAQAAEVAHGTVYLYFRSKDELLVRLFAERLGALVAAARERLAAEPDAPARLCALVRLHLEALAADRDLAVVTQVELRQARAELRERIQAALRAYLELIDEVVREGQRAGAFDPDVDPRQARNVIFGALDQTVTAWVMTGFRFDLRAQVEPTCRLLLRGLAARPATAAAVPAPGEPLPALAAPPGGEPR